MSVRGFKNHGELIERSRNLKNRISKLSGVSDVEIAIRGSSVTGQSSKGGEFRWSPLKDASDVDFFFTSPTLERKLDKLGVRFQPDGRLRPSDIAKVDPTLARALDEYKKQTTDQLGRKGDATLLRGSLSESLESSEHVKF